MRHPIGYRILYTGWKSEKPPCLNQLDGKLAHLTFTRPFLCFRKIPFLAFNQSKACQRSHWKLHKPLCQRLTDVRSLAIAPLLQGSPPPDGKMTALTLVTLQIYKHFGKRANDYLVYESAVKQILDDPVAMYGWSKLRIKSVCCDQEQSLLLENGVDVSISGADRRYACYVMPVTDEESDEDLIDLGRWSRNDVDDTRPIGSGTDEFSYRHPGTLPKDDEKVAHLGHPASLYSPITTKASKHIRAIAFVGKLPEDGVSCSGRLVAAYKNQFAIRVDNARKCINYDCYEYKPQEGSGRHRSEDPKHLPIQPQIQRFYSTISCQLPCGVRSIDEQQEVRTICHLKALSGDFFHSRCFRFRLPLKFVSGIRLLREDQSSVVESPTVSSEEKETDDDTSPARTSWDVAGALVLQVSRPPDPRRAPFCYRHVAHSNPSFHVVGDWTPNNAASHASRHYIYGAFDELKELASHLCVIDERIAALFEHGGGTLSLQCGANLAYRYAPVLGDVASPLVDPQIAEMLASSSSLFGSKSAQNIPSNPGFQDSLIMEEGCMSHATNKVDEENGNMNNKDEPLPVLTLEDAPADSSFDGSVVAVTDCVKDRLLAMAEAGNHEGAMFIAHSLRIR